MSTSTKEKALKSEGMTNERQNMNSRTLICNKIVHKFVCKLRKYRIQLKDILSFLGFDYLDASFIILHLVVIGIIITKIR